MLNSLSARQFQQSQLAWVACRLNQIPFSLFYKKKNWFTTPTPTKEMSALTISDSDNVVLPFGKQLAANGKPLVSEIHWHLFRHMFSKSPPTQQRKRLVTKLFAPSSNSCRLRPSCRKKIFSSFGKVFSTVRWYTCDLSVYVAPANPLAYPFSQASGCPTNLWSNKLCPKRWVPSSWACSNRMQWHFWVLSGKFIARSGMELIVFGMYIKL